VVGVSVVTSGKIKSELLTELSWLTPAGKLATQASPVIIAPLPPEIEPLE